MRGKTLAVNDAIPAIKSPIRLKSCILARAIQKILGHAQIGATHIYLYAQILDDTKKREMAKLKFE
jgi:integrase